MELKETVVLLPCDSLDDFPTHFAGQEAEGLLACWTAPWHPWLVACAETMPRWQPVTDPLAESENRLILVPAASEQDLAEETRKLACQDTICLLIGMADRDEIIQTVLARLHDARPVDHELAADFYSLGYCYLQIELLTRHMRYTSNLDESYFGQQLVAAAKAAIAGDGETSRDHLSKCFDVLAEERDHYYPVDAYLIDLTLVGTSTIGAGLRAECSRSTAVNLLIPPSVLTRVKNEQPDSWNQVTRAITDGSCCLVSGPQAELPVPLMSGETILRQLKRGLSTHQSLLRNRPVVYGQRRFGLTPFLPQVLHKLGFEGALHATFDDGKFPESGQSKTRWEGMDGTAIDVMARVPLDANRPETFLHLASKISESMETDYVATIGLAHWAGHSSCWYDDLRRCMRYTPALGKLVTLTDFFRESAHGGHLERFEPDKYWSPYLKQAVDRGEDNPVSRIERYWRFHAMETHTRSMSAFSAFLSDCVQRSHGSQEVDQTVEIGTSFDPHVTDESLDDQLDGRLQEVAAEVANKMIPTTGDTRETCVVLNPSNVARRAGLELPPLFTPRQAEPIYAMGESGERRFAVVDIPPTGYTLLRRSEEGIPSDKRAPLAEDGILRNEFFEAHFDEDTGGLRAIYDFRTRGNRLSQQLALRANKDGRYAYTDMQCESLGVTLSNPAVGEITSHGQLIDGAGNACARYEQRYRVWRGSRVLSIDVQLEPLTELSVDPWNSYYACRFAWPDEAADLYRGANMTRHRTEAQRLESPLFVEVEGAETRTTLLTGGLPYHRRDGLRRLDTLLLVKGETARRFRLGIGIDLKQSIHEAFGMLAATPVVRLDASAAGPHSGWLFHVDSRSVFVTYWAVLQDDLSLEDDRSNPSEATERVVGFRVRLLETAGKTGRVTISSFRPVKSAVEVDFQGNQLADCHISEGKIQLEMSAYQWSEIEARWEPK